MRLFQTADEAKQFFIEKIAEQALRDNQPLSDVERKMLRWTELYPIPGMPPEELMELNQQFEAEYDSDEYESKIAGLFQRAYEHETEDARQDWKAAYDVLGREDHYILVMIDQALAGKLKKKRFLGIF